MYPLLVACFYLLLSPAYAAAPEIECENAQASVADTSLAPPAGTKFDRTNYREIVPRLEAGTPIQFTSIRGNVREVTFLGFRIDKRSGEELLVCIQEGSLIELRVGSMQGGEVRPTEAPKAGVARVRDQNAQFIQNELFNTTNGTQRSDGSYPPKIWLVADRKTGRILSASGQEPADVASGHSLLEVNLNTHFGNINGVGQIEGKLSDNAVNALFPPLHAALKSKIIPSTSPYGERDFVKLNITQKNAAGARRKTPIKGWVHLTFTDGSALFLPEGGHGLGDMIVIENLTAAAPNVLQQKNAGAGMAQKSYPNTAERLTDRIVDALQLGSELSKGTELKEKEDTILLDQETGRLLLGPGINETAAAMYQAENRGVKVPIVYKYKDGKLREISYTRPEALEEQAVQILKDAVKIASPPPPRRRTRR